MNSLGALLVDETSAATRYPNRNAEEERCDENRPGLKTSMRHVLVPNVKSAPLFSSQHSRDHACPNALGPPTSGPEPRDTSRDVNVHMTILAGFTTLNPCRTPNKGTLSCLN